MRGLETAYRLFGLLPDTLELRALLLDLYTEQVAGYYDPDSATLFGVAGADRAQLRLVLAHEMVHALQGQYLPLDSILQATANNDRLTAAQAILEGQATLASIDVLAPGQDVTAHAAVLGAVPRPGAAAAVRDAGVRARAAGGAGGADLPLSRRRGVHALVGDAGPKDTLPYGRAMPVSTEQILHPDRYARGRHAGAARLRAGQRAWCTRTCWARTRSGCCSPRWRGSDEVQTWCRSGGAATGTGSSRRRGARRWSGMSCGTTSARPTGS